jgi:hypothetical protein
MTEYVNNHLPGPTGPISGPPPSTPLPASMQGDTPEDSDTSRGEIVRTTDGRAVVVPGTVLADLAKHLPPESMQYLREPDGAYPITERLKADADPSCEDPFNTKYYLVAQYYALTDRLEVAAYVYWQQYDALQTHEQHTGTRLHKGYPLVKLSEIYERLGWGSLAERYRMLTLVEDAITSNGHCDRKLGGVFWRLWPRQIANPEAIDTHFAVAHKNVETYEDFGFCPEAVLQELDGGWGQRVPEGRESSQWVFNRHYYSILQEKIRNGKGDNGRVLERLASYLMSCMPGVTTRRRALTSGTDLDVFCSFEGALNDFRADLGRHWICECKDTTDPVGFADVAKFARVLDASRCKAGVLFAPAGASGAKDAWYADREITKLFQQHGIAILVVDKDHLERIGEGESFIAVLRRVYEKVRHDLWKEPPQEAKA